MGFQQLDRSDQDPTGFNSANHPKIALASWVLPPFTPEANPQKPSKPDLLRPLRQKLDRFEIRNPRLAHRLCRVIPAQCPFERDVKLFGKKLFHIPPMCKLNPLYEEVASLRFRALCYLADECGEDVSAYC